MVRGAGMTRLLAEPEPITVDVDAAGLPVRFVWRGIVHEVDLIANRWRVTSTWWIASAAAAREYVKLSTAEGLLCTIYRDLTIGESAADGWYMARVFD